jgi:hypothetical protein
MPARYKIFSLSTDLAKLEAVDSSRQGSFVDRCLHVDRPGRGRNDPLRTAVRGPTTATFCSPVSFLRVLFSSPFSSVVFRRLGREQFGGVWLLVFVVVVSIWRSLGRIYYLIRRFRVLRGSSFRLVSPRDFSAGRPLVFQLSILRDHELPSDETPQQSSLRLHEQYIHTYRLLSV